MFKNININKETIKTAGIVAGKIGKAIVIEGIKGVLLKSAHKAITTSFEGGMDGVKQLGIDDYLGKKKKLDVSSENKSRPKETKVVIDGEFEVVEKQVEDKLH